MWWQYLPDWDIESRYASPEFYYRKFTYYSNLFLFKILKIFNNIFGKNKVQIRYFIKTSWKPYVKIIFLQYLAYCWLEYIWYIVTTDPFFRYNVGGFGNFSREEIINVWIFCFGILIAYHVIWWVKLIIMEARVNYFLYQLGPICCFSALFFLQGTTLYDYIAQWSSMQFWSAAFLYFISVPFSFLCHDEGENNPWYTHHFYFWPISLWDPECNAYHLDEWEYTGKHFAKGIGLLIRFERKRNRRRSWKHYFFYRDLTKFYFMADAMEIIKRRQEYYDRIWAYKERTIKKQAIQDERNGEPIDKKLLLENYYDEY